MMFFIGFIVGIAAMILLMFLVNTFMADSDE